MLRCSAYGHLKRLVSITLAFKGSGKGAGDHQRGGVGQSLRAGSPDPRWPNVTPPAGDTVPAILDEPPYADDNIPGLSAALKARLFAAFDLQVLWNKPGNQATVHAEITEATLRAIPAILDPTQDGYDDTAASASSPVADLEDLFETPPVHRINREARIHRDNRNGPQPGWVPA